MQPLSDAIAPALAPGLALTSIIFYNTSLQNRFVYITGRVRELNREARALRPSADAAGERIESIRRQVLMMSRRSLLIRRAVLVVYGGFLSFVTTVLLLLLRGAMHTERLDLAATFTFAVGLLTLLLAASLSTAEMFLSHRTVEEDIRTSFPPA